MNSGKSKHSFAGMQSKMTNCFFALSEGNVMFERRALVATDRPQVRFGESIGDDKQRVFQASKPGETPTLQSIGPIAGNHGPLPSPFPVLRYKHARGEPSGRRYVRHKEIRRWVRDASKYHNVPHEMLAILLQLENKPGASLPTKFLQFAERNAQTHIQDLNKRFGNPLGKLDRVLGDFIPNGIYAGSAGLMNMSAGALKSAAAHSERFHKRPPIPEPLRIRQDRYNSDMRIPGADWRSDLYYGAAHLREIFDRYGRPWQPGQPLPLALMKQVFSAYNGSGDKAKKYGDDAMRLLVDAALGKKPLYFYEQ